MILAKFIVIVFNLFIYLCKVLEFTYRYQLKEYRYDRMGSYLNETGWWKVLYSPALDFPGKKIRNLGIVGVLFISALISSYFVYDWHILILLGIGAVAPIIALFDVSILVAISGVLATRHREAIIKRAVKKLQNNNVPLIMISGSYGKSSVKEYLYEIMKGEFKVAKTDANMNTDVGVALSILKNLKNSTEYFIAEVGAYKIGEIAKICRSFPPKIVIITAFGNQHLDLYGSKENLVAAESEPLAFLEPDDLAVLNKDIPEFPDLKKLGEYAVKTYSMKSDSADSVATKITAGWDGTRAEIVSVGQKVTITTKLLGTHVVQNLLPAITVARHLGLKGGTISAAISRLEHVPHKLSVHSGPHGSTILSDSSNSNVEGFIEAIRVLATFPQAHKVIISKGIIELGNEKKPSYERIIRALHTAGIHLYTTDNDFVNATDSAHTTLFRTEEGIQAALAEHMDKDTVLLIEGRFSPDFLHAFRIK